MGSRSLSTFRKVLAVVGMLLMIAFLIVTILATINRPSTTAQAIVECHDLYRHAHSRADTATTDRHFPVFGTLRGSSRLAGPLSCGDLRLSRVQGL